MRRLALLLPLLLGRAARVAGTPIYVHNEATIVFPSATCAASGNGYGGMAPCDPSAIVGLDGVSPAFACNGTAVWSVLAISGRGITNAATNWVLGTSRPTVYFNAKAVVLNFALQVIAPNWTSLFTQTPLERPIGCPDWVSSCQVWTGFNPQGLDNNDCYQWEYTGSDPSVFTGDVILLDDVDWNFPETTATCGNNCLSTLCACAAAAGTTPAPTTPPVVTNMPTSAPVPTTSAPTLAPVPTVRAPTAHASPNSHTPLIVGLSIGIPVGLCAVVAGVYSCVRIHAMAPSLVRRPPPPQPMRNASAPSLTHTRHRMQTSGPRYAHWRTRPSEYDEHYVSEMFYS